MKIYQLYRKLILMSILILGFICSCSTQDYKEAMSSKEGQAIKVNGYSYDLFLPKNYSEKKKYPLLFTYFYHQSYQPIIRSFVNKHNLVVAVMKGKNVLDGNSIKDLIKDEFAIYQSIINNYGIDINRVYATGWSGGGLYTLEMASYYPDIFAAIAPEFPGADYAKEIYFDNSKNPKAVYYHRPISFAMNLASLPIRIMPDHPKNREIGLSFTSYITSHVKTYGSTNIFIDWKNWGYHSKPGMYKDFPRMLSYCFKYKRNPFPRSFNYIGFTWKDTMYYIKNIVCKNPNDTYSIAVKVKKQKLYIETRNIKQFSFKREVFQKLMVSNKHIVVNEKSISLNQDAVIRVSINNDVLDYYQKNVSSRIKINSVKAEINFTKQVEIQGRYQVNIKIEKDTDTCILQFDKNINIKSISLKNQTLSYKRLWDITTEKISYRIKLPLKVKKGQQFMFVIQFKGVPPTDLPHSKLWKVRKTNNLVGHIVEMKLKDLMPLAFNSNSDFTYNLSILMMLNRSKHRYLLSSLKSKQLKKKKSIQFLFQGRYNEDKNHRLLVLNNRQLIHFNRMVKGKRIQYKYYVPSFWNYAFGLLRIDDREINAALKIIYPKLIDYFYTHFPMPRSQVTVLGDDAGYMSYNFFVNKVSTMIQISKRSEYLPQYNYPFVMDVLDGKKITSFEANNLFFPFLKGEIGIVNYASPMATRVEHSFESFKYANNKLYLFLTEKNAEFFSKVLFSFFNKLKKQPNKQQLLLMKSMNRYLSHFVLRDLGYMSKYYYELGYLVTLRGKSKSSILLKKIKTYSDMLSLVPKAEMILSYVESIIGKKSTRDFISKWIKKIALDPRPFLALEKLLQKEFGLVFKIQDALNTNQMNLPDLALNSSIKKQGDFYLLNISIHSSGVFPFPLRIESLEKTGEISMSKVCNIRQGKNTLVYKLKKKPKYVIINKNFSQFENNVLNNLVDLNPNQLTFAQKIKNELRRVFVKDEIRYGAKTLTMKREIRLNLKRNKIKIENIKIIRWMWHKKEVLVLTQIGVRFYVLKFFPKGDRYIYRDGYYI